MNRAQGQVRDFHRVFGHPNPHSPTLDEFRGELRCRLILEETLEFIHACGFEVVVNEAPLGFDIGDVEIADAIADIEYINLGSAVEAGIDIEPVFDEVHRSNMAKLGPDGKPVTRAGGKTVKPAGWTPPDIKTELLKQQFPF